MIDPELKEHLVKIEDELSHMRRITSMPRALLHGTIYGAGYVLGTVLIIVIIGWILNIAGVIPALSRGIGEFRSVLENINRPIR
jgi:hypothetical protein